jgi:hypothetical protein
VQLREAVLDSVGAESILTATARALDAIGK